MNILNKIIIVVFLLLFKNTNSELAGEYTSIYNIESASYKTSFVFNDSSYSKRFYYLDEDELIWICNGKYKIENDFMIRYLRRCEFVRSEEPSEPEMLNDMNTQIKDITDTSFYLFLNKNDCGVPDTALFLLFKKEH